MPLRRIDPPSFLQFLVRQARGLDNVIIELVDGLPFKFRVEASGKFEINFYVRPAMRGL